MAPASHPTRTLEHKRQSGNFDLICLVVTAAMRILNGIEALPSLDLYLSVLWEHLRRCRLPVRCLTRYDGVRFTKTPLVLTDET